MPLSELYRTYLVKVHRYVQHRDDAATGCLMIVKLCLVPIYSLDTFNPQNTTQQSHILQPLTSPYTILLYHRSFPHRNLSIW